MSREEAGKLEGKKKENKRKRSCLEKWQEEFRIVTEKEKELAQKMKMIGWWGVVGKNKKATSVEEKQGQKEGRSAVGEQANGG